MNIKQILKKYDTSHLTIGVLGSHSALEVCRGAKDEGFKTLVVAEKGRDAVYTKYFKADEDEGCIDECIVLDKFVQILDTSTQQKLREHNVIFIPHRSFEVYLNDYDAIENNFEIPMFGNRRLLKIEERGRRFGARGVNKKDQYYLMKKAGIRYPKIFKEPKDIDRLVIVKVLEAVRGFERAFFLASTYSEYQTIISAQFKKGTFSEKQIAESVIEEFVMGVHVNFNFFFSRVHNRLELLGTDTRRQTNLEGLARIPAVYQNQVLEKVQIKYEEAGHIAVTVLESMLNQVYELGERFVKTARELIPPGVIGPFALQSIITPGPPKKDIVVVDISPRVPGSPGISSTPYSGYLHGRSVNVGRRIAMEINEAIKKDSLVKIVT